MPILYRMNPSTGTFLPTELPCVKLEDIPSDYEKPTSLPSTNWMAAFDAKGQYIYLGDANGTLYLIDYMTLKCVGLAKSFQTFSFKDLYVHSFGK